MPQLLARAPRRILPIVFALVLAACARDEARPPAPVPAPTPEAAVQRLLDDLRRNDLAAYAVDALPPPLYARTATAWSEGRSRWPLTEVPLGTRLPAALDTLATPGAEGLLRRGYRAQLAGAGADIRSAAAALGLFATRYVESSHQGSPRERDHRLQVIRALSAWAARAPIDRPAVVEPRFPRWTTAARTAALRGDGALSRAGFNRSLVRLGPLMREAKASLVPLGLDVDASIARARVDPVSNDGRRAVVRLRYELAGTPVDAELELERGTAGWYLRESRRHAEAALDLPGASVALGHNAGDGPADAPAVSGRPPTP